MASNRAAAPYHPYGIINGFGEAGELSGGDQFPMWAEVTFYLTASPYSPTVEVRVELEDGEPVLARLAFQRPSPPWPALDPMTIRRFPAGRLFEDCVSLLALAVARKAADREEVEERARRTVRRRRVISDELLKEVADHARANPRAPTTEVKERMFTSHRNATRWLGLARKRGLLEPYSPPKAEG